MNAIYKLENKLLGFEIKYWLITIAVLFPVDIILLLINTELKLNEITLLVSISIVLNQIFLSSYAYWYWLNNCKRVLGKSNQSFTPKKGIHFNNLIQVLFVYGCVQWFGALPITAITINYIG